MLKKIKRCETYLEPTGRIIIGAFFLLAGVSKFTDLSGATEYISSVGLPMASALAITVAAFEVLVGLALIVGKYTKYAALLLAGFTLIASILFHSPNTWVENPVQQIMFMKNIALMGGLLFMAAHLTNTCHSNNSTKTENN